MDRRRTRAAQAKRPFAKVHQGVTATGLVLASPLLAMAQDPNSGGGSGSSDSTAMIVWGIAFVMSILALVQAWFFFKTMMKADEGNERMVEIAGYVREGANAYLKQQYIVVGIFFAVIFVLLSIAAFVLEVQSKFVPFAFLTGGLFSGLAGWFGMKTATWASSRTAAGAQKSLNQGLQVAFRSGAVMGLTVVGLGLLDITIWFAFLYWIWPAVMGAEQALTLEDITVTMLCFGMGASAQALFARVGGGIFTKAADVGADLVGKVEQGIPEDDPRNPATIADNVGDNVGDCAGMAADLFETYVVTIVGTMLLAGIFFTGNLEGMQETMMFYPLAIGAICIIASIFGTFFVRLGKSQDIMGALYKGCIATGIAGAAGIAWLTDYLIGFNHTFIIEGVTITGLKLFYCCMTGLVVTGLIMWITEYYTLSKYRPVKSIAEASTTGHGTNIIQGIAVSMEATALPVLVVCAGILISFLFGHLYGVAIAATTMLALAGMIVALDAYGPVTDNAGGIAEMANMPSEVRKTTDALDAVGNTTKAVTKGYAIGSAGLAAIVLFSAFLEDLQHYFPSSIVKFELQNPYVVIGLFIGGLLPYLFGALSMMAVGRAAGSVVVEVRRQFKEIPGIMEGTAKPDYGRAVDLLTKSAIKEMIIPSLLPVSAPIILYYVIKLIGGQNEAFAAVGAMLLGVVVTGLFVGLSMTSGGGAWDNAKKLIEDGAHGGKGSEAHKAAVTGDTVGDPYKDTAGPAINPMIKITNIVALLLLAILANGVV